MVNEMLRLFLIASIVLVVCAFLSLSLLCVLSPGKIKPYVGEDGEILPFSISEKTFININGIRQGMFIKGQNMHNPILLYLHGGMPDYFLKQRYPTKLEEDFVVVWWEQRGVGMSYNPNVPLTTVTQDQLIADTLKVTDYLRKRFNKNKIFLMGHSGGTFIGMQVIAQSPERYEAYIGVAQMSNQFESEKLAYDYMLNQFRLNKDTKMVQRLVSHPVVEHNKISPAYLKIRDQAMHRLGIGTTHGMHSVISGVFLLSLASPEYTLKEKINTWRSKSKYGISILSDTILSSDLSQRVKAVNIPVYFFHGRYDYTVSYALAKAYFQTLEAPVKGFYTFEHSAHSPMFEESEQTQKIIREDVLKKKNILSDH